MKKIQVFIALFITVLVYSCNESKNEVGPAKKSSSLKISAATDLLANPNFYSIYYGDHPNLTVSQYVLKARKNGTIGVFGFGNTLISAILNWNSATHSAIQNSNRNDLVADLNSASKIPKYFTFSDGKQYIIYRNWTYSSSKPKPFIIRSQDMQFAATSPFYYLSGFMSCNLDPNSAISFGIPQKIISMPSTLKFTQEWNSGNPGHIGIKPVNTSITQPNMQSQLDLITVEAAQ